MRLPVGLKPKGHPALRILRSGGAQFGGGARTHFIALISIASRLTVTILIACFVSQGCGVSPNTAKATASAPSPSTSSVSTLRPNANIVIGQLNLWYYGPGRYGGFEAWDGSGKSTVRLQPLLGDYHSADPAIAQKQIDWAADHGVDAFSIEWISPRGEPGSIEDNLDMGFLRAPNLCRIRWLIFLDFNLHLTERKIDYSHGVDFNNPEIRTLFVDDLTHLATKYFSQPQYLKLDDRPVVYVWATWNFQGNVAGAMQEARQRLKALGFDVYLVGDEVRADSFNPAHVSLWDATTSFIPFLMPGAPLIHTLPEAANFVDGAFTRWQQEVQGLTVAGRTDPVAFQPGFTPQYDDTLFRTANGIGNPTSIQAQSQAEVESLASVSLAHATPVPGTSQRLIWLNTFNNWAETTTVEPTAAAGSKYPAGNYQFDMLNVISDIFGSQTYGTGVSSCHV
jgi:hypothetical protein